MRHSEREVGRVVVAQEVGCSGAWRRCRAETQGTGRGSRLCGGSREGIVTENGGGGGGGGGGFFFIKHLGN